MKRNTIKKGIAVQTTIKMTDRTDTIQAHTNPVRITNNRATNPKTLIRVFITKVENQAPILKPP